MIPSKYNLVTKLEEDKYAVFNPLSGAFDIANSEEKERFEKGIPQDEREAAYWQERGYYFKTKTEQKIYIAKRYQDFLEASNENQVQFMLVLTYGCNFDCLYCYQKGINKHNVMTIEMLDKFIEFVVDYKKNTNKEIFVSLFGGEPLLLGQKQKELITHLVDKLSENSIGLAVVTNGYNLEEYIPILKKAFIKEIHLTIDGDRIEHNRRRQTKDGKDSFDKIVSGIQAALKENFPINVRMVIDRKNIASLVELAKYFNELGFLDLPKSQFKTALGRNYELIEEYVKQEDLFTIDQIYAEYTKLMLANPVLQKLHLPSYFGISKMIDSGEMYTPSFDTCPAAKSEFVFDPSGQIFGCTASCGREGYELGKFYPETSWNEERLKEWQTRNILNIPECKDCSVAVVCGGGCGVIAKDRNGKVHSSNCKPIKEVMDIGIEFYKKTLLQEVK